jgi:hypothetical protein
MTDSKCERSSRNMLTGEGWGGRRGTVNLLILNIGGKFEWLV